MSDFRNYPKNYDKDLVALKKLSQKINRLIEEGTFYKYPYWQRYNEIRKLNKLYRRLLGRVPVPKLQHVLAAAIVLVAGSACNLDDIKAGLLARSGNTAPTVVIEEGNVFVPHGALQIFTAVVTDPNTGDTHTFKWYVNGEEQEGAVADTFEFRRTPISESVYTVTVEVSDGTATAEGSANATVGPYPDFSDAVNFPFGMWNSPPYPHDFSPAVVDIDGDGDLDFLMGNATGGFEFFENTGSAGSPAFGNGILNPWNSYMIPTDRNIAVADLDNDGDFDLLSSFNDDVIYYQQNTGTAASPNFAVADDYPFGISGAFYKAVPALADIDADGDYDAFIGTAIGGGRLYYYENTGTATSPSFSFVEYNPFGLSGTVWDYKPFFADIDLDGDLDLFAGSYDDRIFFWENIGTPTAPQFGSKKINPFNLLLTFAGDDEAAICFADFDGDGDLDAFLGSRDNFGFLKNNSIQ